MGEWTPLHASATRSSADVVRLGFLIALAGALQAAEGFVPSPAPWFRVGLGNAFVLASLLRWGPAEGVWVALGKVVVGGLLGGRFLSPAFALSLAGGLCAAGSMALASRVSLLGCVGVSVVGAQCHAWAQLGLASVLLRTPSVWALAPLLSMVSVAGGLVTGVAARSIGAALEEAVPPT